MTRLVVRPNGWPTTLAECPPGHFVYEGDLCFKAEYKDDVFCASGEVFWAGTSTDADRAKLIVQPVIAEWEETDSE